MIQLIISICLISCNSLSNVKESTPPLIESKIKTALKIDFEKGVVSIFEDSNGNLWIGSKEEGVCRFDGINYTYYTTDNGLPSNFVRKIQEDQKGNIWFATGNGISYFDGNSFNVIPINMEWNSTRDPESQSIQSTGKWSLDIENIWFQINNNGLVKYSDGNTEYLAFPVPKEDTSFDKDILDTPYFCPYSALKIYQDKSNKLWIGTFNRGVVEYDGNSFKYHNPSNFGIGTIRSIYQDNEGNHWFGSNGGGVYKYDGEKYINFTMESGLTSSNPGYDERGTLSRVWSIEQDNEGNMWFGTADSGLWKFDGVEIINYTMKNGLPSNFVETIYKDRNGKLWFCSGTDSNGILYTMNGQSFEIINPVEKNE